jgi:hypothetical protein
MPVMNHVNQASLHHQGKTGELQHCASPKRIAQMQDVQTGSEIHLPSFIFDDKCQPALHS